MVIILLKTTSILKFSTKIMNLDLFTNMLGICLFLIGTIKKMF